MNEIREYADPVALVLIWLRLALAEAAEQLGSGDETLDGVTASDRVPTTRSPENDAPLVVVRRSGGVAEPPIFDRPRVDFMCWHSTKYKAFRLANIVRALVLHDLRGQVVDGHTLYRAVEFSGPLDYPDPAGAQVPIVMFTVELNVRVK